MCFPWQSQSVLGNNCQLACLYSSPAHPFSCHIGLSTHNFLHMYNMIFHLLASTCISICSPNAPFFFCHMYCLLSSQQVCILAPLERARHGVGILIWGKRENNTEAKQKNEQNTWKEFFNKEIWKTKHIEKTVWYVCSQVMQLRIKHRFQLSNWLLLFSH